MKQPLATWQTWRPALAGGQLLLLALVSWLTWDVRAHAALHPDADAPGHSCAVVMLAHGLVDATPADMPAAFIRTESFCQPKPMRSVLVLRKPHVLPFACGPPPAEIPSHRILDVGW